MEWVAKKGKSATIPSPIPMSIYLFIWLVSSLACEFFL